MKTPSLKTCTIAILAIAAAFLLAMTPWIITKPMRDWNADNPPSERGSESPKPKETGRIHLVERKIIDSFMCRVLLDTETGAQYLTYDGAIIKLETPNQLSENAE